MKKEILLIEPNYRNKYPPLGLMKISAYHKLKGDNVTFYKGCSKKLQAKKWDRIYVATLFSFYWKQTIKTINFYKRCEIKTKNFFVGGILATTMFDELYKETGIKPVKGLLDKPNDLGKKDEIIIDKLTPDYDILETIDYVYPTNNSYISYMTRGCCNHCKFCAVPYLEPAYIDYIQLKDQIKDINNRYGEKRDLLLMDNNVLASKQFDKIIDEILELGFEKGAKYRSPNLFEIYYNRLSKHYSDIAAENKIKSLLNEFSQTRLKKKVVLGEFQSYISEFGLLDDDNKKYGKRFLTKLHSAYPHLNPIYEKYRNKAPRNRFIDFNQGIDARLLTQAKMKRLSEINIKPLRIAFDNIKDKDIYKEKIRLAAEFSIKELSNYVLYNFIDTPKDLYDRLKINIDLNEELNLRIFSFPMKYIPITDKDRTYIGEHWNRKYLRTIQAILNVTHGAVMPRQDFFEKAFGKSFNEFEKLLLMPEDYIIYRAYSKEKCLTDEWWNRIESIRSKCNGTFDMALEVIYSNDFKNIPTKEIDVSVHDLLEHYKNRVKLSDFNNWKEMRK
ncbi:MAG: cobalamin-binding domain-containing protein [Candidatus Cloacimonetes bacterium]|nr:cobalamin-binding domain-containing protein [Candidatus Cloacimonadota bacterium]